MSMLMVMLFGGKSDKKNPFLNNGWYPSQQIGSEEGVESSLVPFNNYIPTMYVHRATTEVYVIGAIEITMIGHLLYTKIL